MGENSVNKQEKENQLEDSQHSSKKDIGLRNADDTKIWKVKLGTLKQETSSIYRKSQRGNRESFLQRQHESDVRIPKQTCSISTNEKYLQHCLDVAELRGHDSVVLYSLANPCNISMNPKSSRNDKIRRKRDTDSLVIHCPLAAGTGNGVTETTQQRSVGMVVGRKIASNIMRSPRLRQFGCVNDNSNLGRSELTSSSGPSLSSLEKLGREAKVTHLGNQSYEFEAWNDNDNSIFTCSNEPPSSASSTVSRGMLHCKLKRGIPYFVFFVDDEKEVYTASSWKIQSSEDKDLDYIYLFHSRTSSHNAQDLVGKMKVSNSLSLSSNNPKTLDTHFVLFQAKEKHLTKFQSSLPTIRENRKNPFFVSKLNSYKRRSSSKFSGVSSICEDFSWDSSDDTFDNLDASRRNLVECSPNLELVAIVMKTPVCDNSEEEIVGGWGLKFLEKANFRASVSSDTVQESCLQNRSDSRASMTVLVAAGIHGQPITNQGGPSSLIERWLSGGKCDCGGWDIGCPLRVLNDIPTKQFELPYTGAQEDRKQRDLIIEGQTKQDLPTLKMAKMEDGLYEIHFQSTTLSSLQAFSIGVANIHAQNPSLYPKHVEKLKQQNSR